MICKSTESLTTAGPQAGNQTQGEAETLPTTTRVGRTGRVAAPCDGETHNLMPASLLATMAHA